MKIRHAVFGLAVAWCASVSVPRASLASSGSLNVHNQTGHTVNMFLFNDGNVHLTPAGGVEVKSALANGGNFVVHPSQCLFSLLLVDTTDGWHAEYHDCVATDLTFAPTTNHFKRQ
jgi:hypothetical protein